MNGWLHSDDYCPRRPLLGRRPGREYRCKCGRVWRWDVDVGVLSDWRRWTLVGHREPA